MRPQRIVEIGVTPIPAFYRKEIGKNAYADNIGMCRLEWLVRARTDGGFEGLTIANRYMRQFSGFYGRDGTVAGLVHLLREVFLGHRVDEFLDVSDGRVTGVKRAFARAFRLHGWMSILAFDLLGQAMGVSCVDLLGGWKRYRIPAYDTTLYFQEFLAPEKGVGQVVEEAIEACQAGYRQLKIKVGRGGRWMLPEDGMHRDCEVVLAVREAVGPDVRIMVDANFGYDGRLDLLETFIRETLPADVFWLEEMVTADVDSYRVIRDIQAKVGSSALLVCGEVDREPISQVFLDLIDEGLIDGYQPDIMSQGFARWLEIQHRLEHTGVRSIPHNFGNGVFGTRASLVFGAASDTFVSLEDERCVPHVYGPDGFVFRDGSYIIANTPGLGLEVDDERFHRLHSQHQVTLRVSPNGGYQ